LFPKADVLYAGDSKWWRAYEHLWQNFKGVKFSISKEISNDIGCVFCPRERQTGLGLVGLSTANNSGHQAVNLAFLLGAKSIWLLGFDMYAQSSQKNHFFGNHKGKDLTNPHKQIYTQWLRHFEEMVKMIEQRNVEVINYTRDTALNVKRGNLDDL